MIREDCEYLNMTNTRDNTLGTGRPESVESGYTWAAEACDSIAWAMKKKYE